MDGNEFSRERSSTDDTENPVKKRLRAKTTREKRAARKDPPRYKCVACDKNSANPERLCLPVPM